MVKTLLIFLLIVFLGIGVLVAQKRASGQSSASFKQIDPAGFKQKMGEKQVVVLDVRTAREVQGGTIPGARVIDYLSSGFSEKVDKLDRDKTYLVYCKSGARSAKACRVMSKMGFTQLYNLAGGYMRWKHTTP